MTSIKGFVRPVLGMFIVSLIMTAPARAAVSCHKINARGVGQDLGQGMTTAEIVGGGLLHGTTVGNFVITGVSGTVAAVEGLVTFTTNHGTLSVAVTGTFDIATGEFNTSGPVSSATGKLSGATGNLSITGIQEPDGSFVEDVTGVICVDLAP